MSNTIRRTEEWYARRMGPPKIIPAAAKPSKYRNRKITTEHGAFDSEKEARRYAELVLFARTGEIHDLRRQVRYALVVNGVHVCDYVADAVYSEGGRLVVEDTKSEFTRKLPVFRIKKCLMLACHGVSILET